MVDAIPEMSAARQELARNTRGWMYEAEGRALYESALEQSGRGVILEIGTFCGKSTIYLAAGAEASGGKVVTVDHHRGSEEHQVGEEYHDPSLLDADFAAIDTLPYFRSVIRRAGLESTVVAVVGHSEDLAKLWGGHLAMLFLDAGHTQKEIDQQYDAWSKWVVPGGYLAFHDVYEEHERWHAPLRTYQRALDSGLFKEVRAVESLRVLERIDNSAHAGTE